MIDFLLVFGSSFVTSIIIARFYGPQEFGDYTYAQSTFLILSPFLAVGSELVVIRSFSAAEDISVAISRARRYFNFSSSVVGVTAFIIVAISHSQSALVAMAYAMYSIASTLAISEYYFKFKRRPGPIIVAKSLVLSLGMVVKFFIGVHGIPYYFVALAYASEYLILWSVIRFAQMRELVKPAEAAYVGWSEVVEFGKLALPIALSGVVVAFSFRAPQIGLTLLSSAKDAGLFAICFQFLMLANAAPQLITSSIFPRVAAANLASPQQFDKLIEDVVSLYTLIGILAAIALPILALFVVPVLAGSAYRNAFVPMLFSAPATIFLFSGAARNQYIIVKNLARIPLLNAFMGLVTFAPLAAILVPRFGASGAGAAFAVACLVSGVLSSFAFRQTWKIGRIQLLALMPHRGIGALFRILALSNVPIG